MRDALGAHPADCHLHARYGDVEGRDLKLCWRGVGFDSHKITVIAKNAKTAKQREIGITARLYTELERLWKISPLDPDRLVFGIKADFKNAWTSALGDAKIKDFHFHDCRHTCNTRWVAKGMTIEQLKPRSAATARPLRSTSI
jgi:integrase